MHVQYVNEEHRRTEPRHPASLIGSIGSLLGAEWFPHIQRAQLKRYRAGRGGRGEMVALRVLAESGVPIETMRLPELQRWIWLVHCMAFLSGSDRDPHSTKSDARPGSVLYRAGYNEFRLRRLLDARGERFQALLERAVRRIARLGEPINWAKLAPLVLPQNPDSGWADNARIELARDFAVAAVRGDLKQHSAVGDNPDELLLVEDTDD